MVKDYKAKDKECWEKDNLLTKLWLAILLTVTVIILALWTRPVLCYYPFLSDSLTKSATDCGYSQFIDEKSSGDDSSHFHEWAFGDEQPFQPGDCEGVVCTKFFIIAFNTYKQARVYENLPSDWVSKKREEKDLGFALVLYSNTIDFAKDLQSVIFLDSNRVIHPIDIRNDDTADLINPMYKPYYMAHCFHSYNQNDIPPNAKITFVVIPNYGKERKYKIDLSKMR